MAISNSNVNHKNDGNTNEFAYYYTVDASLTGFSFLLYHKTS